MKILSFDADKTGESIKKFREKTVFQATILFVLLAVCILSVIVSVSFGALRIPLDEVVKAIIRQDDSVNRQVIWNIRLPRTFVAGLTGICLSLSGVILQGVMRNPLASPGIIGVSSGAGLAAVVILIVLPNYYHLVTPAAFLGALAASVLIYFLSWKNGVNPMRLILSGVAVSALLGAGIDVMMVLYPERVHGVVGFMVGSLSARTWKHFYLLWPYSAAGSFIAMIMSRKLNILMLGDEMATSLGIKVERVRMVLIALASLLSASAVSIVGLLGFVGLIVPHMTRLIIGSDHRYLVPASALAGAALLIICDTVARVVMDPVELPVGIIMAALGAPFFLYLLRGGRKSYA